MTDTELIRAFERDILDRHHESYNFFRYSEDIVIPYLLQTLGDTERYRDELINNGQSETNVSVYFTNMMYGLGHCIRWLIKRNSELPALDHFDGTYSDIHEAAADFLSWGTGYHMSAQEFIGWSRGIKHAELDKELKSVTFYNPDGFDYSSIYSKQLLYGSRMQKVFSNYPHETMDLEFEVWLKDIDINKPPIINHMRWARARTSQSFPLLYSKICEILFPELNEKTDFEGYMLKDLRQFYTLVFLNFHFIRWVENYLDLQVRPGNLAFGSNPIEFKPGQFPKFMAMLTGLEENVTANIIADLTFNPSNLHTGISIQPFVCSSNGTHFILPNLFVQLEPARMVVGALNKGIKKKRYDRLINAIEKANLKSIHERLELIKNSFCYIEKSIKFMGRQYTPDIILVDFDRKCILVADYKHFIGPITASEVDYKMKEMGKALNQVNTYINALSQLNNLNSKDILGFSVTGMIITHKPMPIPIPIINKLPITDLETFFFIVDQVCIDDNSLVDLISRILFEDAEEPKYEFETIEASIAISEWTVKRSQHRIVNKMS